MPITKITMSADKSQPDIVVPAIKGTSVTPQPPAVADVVAMLTSKINELVDVVNAQNDRFASLEIKLPKLF